LLCCFLDGRSFFCDQSSGLVRRLPGLSLDSGRDVDTFGQLGGGVTDVDAQMRDVDAQLACSASVCPHRGGGRGSGRQGIRVGLGVAHEV
jgi:hypothetical protein